MTIVFWSPAKTHFTLSLVLKVRAFGTRTCPPHFTLSSLSLATTKLPNKLMVKFVPQNSPIVNLYNLMDIELN